MNIWKKMAGRAKKRWADQLEMEEREERAGGGEGVSEEVLWTEVSGKY
jgi:hypothetical protein